MVGVIVLLWSSATSLALTVDIDSTFTRTHLGKGLEILVDTNADIDLKDAQSSQEWYRSTDAQLKFGYSAEPHWFRFKLKNRSAGLKNLIVEISHSYLDQIDFFLIDENGRFLDKETMGDLLSVDHRPIAHAHFLYPIELPVEQQLALYIRVESSSTLKLPLVVWERSTFVASEHRRTVLLTVFFGMLLIISVYHLMLAVLLRDMTIVYFSVFIVSLLVLFSLREGVSALMLWPQTPNLNHYMNVFAFSLGGSSACLFVVGILLLKESSSKYYQAIRAFALIAILPSIAILFANYSDVLRFSLIISLMIVIVCCAALVRRVKEGYPPARHLIYATVFATLGVSVGILTTVGILPLNEFTQAVIYAGIALMALFYALAISYRINVDRELRIVAQRKLSYQLDELVRERTEALEAVNEQLRVVSITDGLTQVYNRRHFDQVIQMEYNRAYRERSCISLLLLDIDHFKQINDSYGHSFGDYCLQVAAKVLLRAVHRPSDLVARYGGEEFVLLLPETELNGAVHIALEINKAIAVEVVEKDNVSVQMTASIGVACHIPEQSHRQEELIKVADELLYKAKQSGRNRVEFGVLEERAS